MRREAALNEGSREYAARRSELILVAVTLFKEKGYRSTTFNDIAKHAGLDRATVYYYFGSKEEFLRDAVQGILDDNLAEAERLVRSNDIEPREKLRKFVEKLIVSYETNYPQMYVYIQQDMHEIADQRTSWVKLMASQTHRLEKAVLALIADGVKRGVFRRDVPVELAANAIFGMLNWTHRWHKPGGKRTAQEIAAAFARIFFDGICTD